MNNEAHRVIQGQYPCDEIPDAVEVTAVTDTGAQTCTAGLEILKLMKCDEEWLVKTSHRICGVNNAGLSIRGALVTDITLNNIKTTEIMYICDNVSGIYLSQTALKKLGMIEEDFPRNKNQETYATPMSANANKEDASNTTEKAPCGCPLRKPCPPLLDKLPLPADNDHRAELEEWIKQHFASSAFNTCTHQKMPEMTGEPLKINFKDDHLPTAVHKAINVAHHWKSQVKQKLDDDVELGTLEKVPLGKPTSWCSRMIVVPKIDATPRRTVDLRKLNEATLRETHPSPTVLHSIS